jgi:hypothetical protein
MRGSSILLNLISLEFISTTNRNELFAIDKGYSVLLCCDERLN